MPKTGDNFYQNIKTVVMKMRYAVEDILLLLVLKKIIDKQIYTAASRSL